MGQPQETIQKDLLCTECGRNLIGQLKTGECPECGLLVGYSIPTVMLKDADPGWVGSLRSGFNWLVIGIAFNILFAVFVSIRTSLWLGRTARDFSDYDSLAIPDWHQVTDAVLLLIVMNLLCIAVWKITQPEPDGLRAVPARDITRWALVPSYVLALLAALVYLVQTDGTTALAILLHSLSALLSLIGTLFMLSYLRQLALRLPDESLATQTTWIQWLMVIAVVILVFALFRVVFNASTRNAPVRSTDATGLAILILAGLLWLALSIWWILLVLRFRNWFAQAHQLAIYNAHNARTVRY